MTEPISRRSALRLTTAATAAVAAGAVAGPALSGTAQAHGNNGPSLPKVPGMRGDRRANEFWYQMDELFYYHPSPEVGAAFGQFSAVIGGYNRVWDLWLESRQAGTYPDSYASIVAPAQDALQIISSRQLEWLYDTYYRHDFLGLTRAFVAFGEGTLFDPRRPAGEEVHTMDPSNGGPPKNYHRWYAILQANILLGIDAHRWRPIANLAGLAWGIQSVAKPVMNAPNPPQPARVVLRQSAYWLTRNASQLHTEFQNYPYPVGIS